MEKTREPVKWRNQKLRVPAETLYARRVKKSHINKLKKESEKRKITLGELLNEIFDDIYGIRG